AKLEAPVVRAAIVAGAEFTLDLGGTLNGLDDASELSSNAIAGNGEDAAVVALDKAGHRLPVEHQGLERTDFIDVHEAAVAVDIRAKNRR
ncbi:MAG: hypothetical protein V3R30_14045, partial [Kiloniellales bacterium]